MPATRRSSFSITRGYPYPPETVFRAWAEPEFKRVWFVDGDGLEWTTESYELDFRVGGHERGVFVRDGKERHANETTILDIVENRRIVFAYTMAIDNVRHSASLAAVEFEPVGEGCSLTFTEQGAYFEGSDGTDGRKAGWDWLLNNLHKALEQ